MLLTLVFREEEYVPQKPPVEPLSPNNFRSDVSMGFGYVVV